MFCKLFFLSLPPFHFFRTTVKQSIMVPTRAILLLLILCIGIAMVTPAAYSDKDIEDDKLAKVNVLEGKPIKYV